MYRIVYDNLNTNEQELFYILCANCYEQMSEKGEFPLDALFDYTKVRKSKRDAFLSSMMNNLLKVQIFEEQGSAGKSYSNFFLKYRIDARKNRLFYELTQDGQRIAGEFVRTYNLQAMVDETALKGKYTRKIYQMLKTKEKAGYFRIGKYEFYDLIGISEDYPVKELTRAILKPSISLISKIEPFIGISFKYAKTSSKASEIVFQWNVDKPQHTTFEERQKKPSETGGSKLMDENFNIIYPFD